MVHYIYRLWPSGTSGKKNIQWIILLQQPFMLYLARRKSAAAIMFFSFCACCPRRWPNSLRWVFECKTHAYKTGGKKKNTPASQPAIGPSRCFPDHWRNCTHAQSNHALIWWYLHTVITETWNQIMCLGLSNQTCHCSCFKRGQRRAGGRR